MIRRVLLLTLTLLVWSTPAHAQDGRADDSVADSTVVRLIAGRVVEQLADYVASALFDSRPKAWSIVVPDSTSPAWRNFAGELSELLRARQATPGDSVQHYLRIAPISTRGDTLIANIVLGNRVRCHPPGGRVEWAGDSYPVRLTTVRHGSSWEGVRTQHRGHGHSPCLIPPKRMKGG